MALNPISQRYPFELANQPPEVVQAHRYAFQGITDLQQAVRAIKEQITAITPATTTATSGGSSSSTTIVGSPGVTSFNTETGDISFFPSLGGVNNQTGVTAYTTQTDDNGSLLILNDSSPIAVTLNFAVSAPWYTTIDNQGPSAVTITPSNGLINSGAHLTLPGSSYACVWFDSVNWWGFLGNHGLVDPMTTEGDMIYESSGAPTRLPIGPGGDFLSSTGTDPAWAPLPIATSSSLGIVEPDNTTITVDPGTGIIHATNFGLGFSNGGTILNPIGAINVIIWDAPFDCFVTKVLGYVTGSSGSVVNAQKNGSLPLLVSNLTLSSTNTWINGGAVQNTTVLTGDKIEIVVVSVAGSPSQIAVEIQYTRASSTPIFAIGGTVLSPTGAVAVVAWYATTSATVTNVLGYAVGATGSTINAYRNGLSLLVSDLTLSSTGTWMDGGAVQNTVVSPGDSFQIVLTSVVGSPSQLAVEIKLTRP